MSARRAGERGVGDWPTSWVALAAAGNLVEGNANTAVPFDLGKGMLQELFAGVRTTCTSSGAATVQLLIQTDDADAFGSPTTRYTSEAVAVASLVAGYRFAIRALPLGLTEVRIRGARCRSVLSRRRRCASRRRATSARRAVRVRCARLSG